MTQNPFESHFTVNVDGFVFRGYPSLDEGCTISPDGWEGWDDSVEARGESVEVQQGVGDYDLPTFPGPRIVLIAGTCWSKTPDKTDAIGRRMKGLLLTGPGRMVVERGITTEWGFCRLAPGVKTIFRPRPYDPSIADFQLQLKFSNPRKFGRVNTFPINPAGADKPPVPAADIVATHYGNYLADPVYTISGNDPVGYVINGPTGFYQVNHELKPGHPHTVRDGRLYIDGQFVQGYAPLMDTWPIKPNVTTLTRIFPSSATALGTCEVTDTSL